MGAEAVRQNDSVARRNGRTVARCFFALGEFAWQAIGHRIETSRNQTLDETPSAGRNRRRRPVVAKWRGGDPAARKRRWCGTDDGIV